ncbi:MAG: polysaccharide biosynthesis protein [Spirochaetales bacterium]|nr:polysaccharide biosynthesis protein [Spirochaetales bacterium]MCF7937082.1 polysaccharide biosynthesis protein [Spirochaetales bacterium]
MPSIRETRIYIIGAGFAGRSIASEIHKKGILGSVVAFLDDDSEKIGTRIEGIPVLGPIDAVMNLVDTTPTDEAIIAIPSADRRQLSKLYSILKQAEFSRIRILPGIAQIVDGEAHLIQAREINPEDLLSRGPVAIHLKESLSYLRGKRVLITGAGGSIGSELARQLLSGGAERLYLLGHGENSIYDIDRELRILQEEGVGEKATIVPVIGELQDRDFVRFIFSRLKADVIFHSAAYKHVPLMEANPIAGIKNNVFGTLNLLDAAEESGVPRLTLISTDKAVNPLSVYGASKLIAEELVLRRAADVRDYLVVRFGNVLGSRGSILPLFRKQILKGGPVTLTHPETSRFFMTIPEASSLVLKTAGLGSGGNLYLLDMGEPVRIRDLAEQMIRFYGFEPYRDIDISWIGMRPGEKVSEHLVSSHENSVETSFEKILRVERSRPNVLNLPELLEKLAPICFLDSDRSDSYRNRRLLRSILQKHIPSLEVPRDEPPY